MSKYEKLFGPDKSKDSEENKNQLLHEPSQNQQQSLGQNPLGSQQYGANQQQISPNPNLPLQNDQNPNQPPPYGQCQNQPPQYNQNPNQPTYNSQQPFNQGSTSQQIHPQLSELDQVKIDLDAANLRIAMKGLSTDKEAIIKLIAHRKNRERLMMIDSYKKQFNRELLKDLKSKLSGHFQEAVLALFHDPISYDCWSLQKAMKGITNEDTLIEILATRPNYYINDIKKKYLELYQRTLEGDLASDLSGDLKKVMLTLASAFRSENMNPNQVDCFDMAEKLYKAGRGKKIGTDENVFYDILTKASGPELKLIDENYNKQYEHGLLKAIDKEFSGKMKKLLQTIVYCSINPSEYFATRVNYAVKGLGTKDHLLIRIIITRHEIDIPQIKEAYQNLYNKDMVKDIEDDTSGDYRKLLVELCSS